jgi:hypothetical protein
MMERLSLIITLELAIARSSAQRRAEMATQLTDLFIQQSNSLPEPIIGLFDEIITRLATDGDAATLAVLAQRLAPIANSPVNVTRMLANDEEIKVAYPILAHSVRLDETTLVHNARTKSQKHLLAISWRKHLTAAITDVLLERDTRHIVLSTTKNPNSRFSEAGVQLLLERSRGDQVIAAVMGSRPDILTILATAPEAVRTELITKNDHVRHEIDRIFAMFADHFRKDAYFTSATETISPQFNIGPLTDDTISGRFEAEEIEKIDSQSSDNEGTSDAFTDKGQRRRVVRQKSFLRGCIYFNSRRASVDCLIRDISPQGARILISSSVNIPDTVELHIPQKAQTLRARVEWRNNEDIGLVFTEADLGLRTQPQANEMSQRIVQLEDEINSLRRMFKRMKSEAEDSDVA